MDSRPGRSREFDIIVIGGGGSGMAAALVARRRGLRVLLVEKTSKLGGTTGMSVGSIMAAGTRQQVAAGIQDSPEEHAADLVRICKNMGVDIDTELTRLFTENVADTVAFLQELGINFLGPMPQPPHSKPRLHQVMPTSRAYVDRLSRACRREGVEILLDAPATRLITAGTSIVGVEVKHGGATLAFNSRIALILASGDIGGDERMMFRYMKTWASNIAVYNPANAGDGHRLAAEAGAHILPRKDLIAESAAHIRFIRPKESLLHKIPANPYLTRAMLFGMQTLPSSLIRPLMMRFLTTTLGPDRLLFEQGAILVNRNGERFVDETGLPNLKIAEQPGGRAWLIFDHAFARKFSAWPYFVSTAPGVAFAYLDDYRATRPDLFNTAQTIERLAEQLGFNPSALRDAVDGVNAERTTARIEQAPFYALGPVSTWLIVAPVGLAVNTKLQVLREDGSAIKGLYAAGMTGLGGYTVTGHGHALGWAFTSGRLAAENAAAQASGLH